jgi:conjugal transfer/type IV secretion protein DotA/TraY
MKTVDRAMVFAGLAVLVWVSTFCFGRNLLELRGGILNAPQAIYVVLFPATLTVFALRDGLRAYQLWNRALVTFPEAIARIVQWVRNRPPSPPNTPSNRPTRQIGQTLKSFLVFSLWATGISLFWPHLLFAQSVAAGGTGIVDTGQATTTLSGAYGTLAKLGSSDLSGQWLARLFPSLSGSSSTDQLSSLLSSFNAILLDGGTGLAFWQGTVGLIYAAQRGGLEGTNIHGVISPLRALLGAGALAPVLGGYCMMQMLALQILGGGYWMANQLYSDMITDTFNAASATPASGAIPVAGMNTLISTALSAETCYAWYIDNVQDAAATDVTTGLSYYQMSNAASGNLATSTNLPWSSGPTSTATDSYTWDLGECGSISLGSAENTNSNADVAYSGGSAFDAARNGQFETFMTAVWNSGLPKALASIYTPNGGAEPGQTPISPPSGATLASDYNGVTSAATTYFNNLQSDGESLTSSGLTSYANAINGTGNNLGWVSAGALYSTISSMYSRTATANEGSLPSLTVTSLEGIADSDQAMIQKSYDEVSSFMSSAVLPTEPTFSSENGNMAPVAPVAGAEFNTETDVHRVLDEPAAELLFRLDNTLLLDPANPMASVVSEGYFMMHVGEAALVGAGVAKAVSFIPGVKAAAGIASAAGGGPGIIAAVISKAASFAVFLGEVLVFVGAFEAFVIPMLFYIAWLFQIVNCIAFAAEFVLAAPLAAFQFMRVNGTEPIGPEQRQFFLLAFMQGFLRPSLLIFGLVISSFVFASIAGVLNATFNLAVASVQGSSIVGPIGIVTYVLMLVFVQWQLCTRSVSLIGRVPDAVADIVGGAAARLSGADEQALGVASQTTGQVRRVTGGVIAYTLGGASKTAQSNNAAAPGRSDLPGQS